MELVDDSQLVEALELCVPLFRVSDAGLQVRGEVGTEVSEEEVVGLKVDQVGELNISYSFLLQGFVLGLGLFGLALGHEGFDIGLLRAFHLFIII